MTWVNAAFNIPMFRICPSPSTLMLMGSLLIYGFGAAWTDLRQRRVANLWSLAFLLLFFVLHMLDGTELVFLIGLVSSAVFLFVPTALGVFGQGDWKMAMVYGAAIGAIPALLTWILGWMLIPWLKPWLIRWSLHHLDETKARSIPVAVPALVGMVSVFVGTTILTRIAG